MIAIADAAGGDWPKRARTAALLLQQAVEEMDEDEVAVQLLHDIDAVFELAGVTEITTAALLIRLHEMEERLWATYGRSETPLKGHQLSTMRELALLEQIILDGTYTPATYAEAIINAGLHMVWTSQEREVLQRAMTGKPPREVSDRLGKLGSE